MKLFKLILLIAFGAGLLTILSTIHACGGLFCTNVPIDQNAERIIFTINDDGTVTAVVGINYVGEAEDFSWIVPVPSVPELDVAETASLNTLQLITNVTVQNPPSACQGIFPLPCCFGGGGGDFLSEGNVGPYDFAIIRNENIDEMVSWLRDNGYQVTEDMIPLINVYVEEGMYFVAMRLTQDATVDQIQPVVMTYESENPMIPIRLTAVAAVDDMPILTWIFADTQYVPENYANPRPDFASFRSPGEVATGSNGNLFFRTGNSLYRQEYARIQDEYDGLAFITEFAGSTESLGLITDDYINDLATRFPYLTRLRAQLSPEQMTVDPVFVPNADAPDVSNIIDLADWVDPLHYWGCSSRTAVEQLTSEVTPTGRTYYENWRMEVAHPDDWIPSTININDNEILILAPETVDNATISAFFNGEATPPMLIMIEVDEYFSNFDMSLSRVLLNHLGQDEEATYDFSRVRLRYGANGGYGDYTALQGILYTVLTSDDDWATNRELYDSILDHPFTYLYYTSPDYMHTLFLNISWVRKNLLMPFPEDWVEVTGNDGDIFITAENDASPTIRITSYERFLSSEMELEEEVNAYRQWVIENYALEDTQISNIMSSDNNCLSSEESSLISFTTDETQGYLRVLSGMIVSAYAPIEDFAQHEALLVSLLESLDFADC